MRGGGRHRFLLRSLPPTFTFNRGGMKAFRYIDVSRSTDVDRGHSSAKVLHDSL